MRGYLGLFKVRFIAGLQYRSAALAGIATQFVWGFMSILLYQVLSTQQMPADQLSTYFWLRQAFLTLIAVWAMDTSLFSGVESGEFAYEWVRPYDLYSFWFVRNLAYRLARCLLRCFPVLVLAFFLPDPFRLHLPVSFASFAFFLVSLLLSCLLIVSINMIILLLTFFTKNSLGVRVIFTGFFDLLDGSSIPYPFFPALLRQILQISFFYGLSTTPFFIYLGRIEPLRSIAFQIGWLIVMIGIGRWLMRHVRYRLEVFGG